MRSPSTVLVLFGLTLACSSGSDDGFTDEPVTGGGGGGGGSAGGVVVSIQGGSDAGGEAGTDGGESSGGEPTTTGGQSDGGAGSDAPLCGTHVCQCANGEDDDGDGDRDGTDAECTGPLDDDEGSFATGIPGDNRDPKWQDCFFDGNSGAGDDGCRYATGCLTGDLDPSDPDCQITDECIEFCRGRTPNGCDCFGCCRVELGDGDVINIVIGDQCSLSNVEDEDACPRCVPSTACSNDCGECELCPGRSVDDLPESCHDTPPPGDDTPGDDTPPPPDYTCDDGQVCGPDLPACPASHYCLLGCCVEDVPR